MGDVWDIGIIAPVARERTGYPTQKPEALLARVIEALSDEGDWVLDPFMGSGTTLVCALGRGRRAIGIDQSPEALTVARARLRQKEFLFADQQVAERASTSEETGVRPALRASGE
jgi:site-specific DNA-methyltransferase (adenine-specific)